MKRLRRIRGLPVALPVAVVLLVATPIVASVDAPLADAAEDLDRSTVLTLLGESVDVNSAQVDGMTALHWAVYYDDMELADALVACLDLENTVHKSFSLLDGDTPLNKALLSI